MIYFVIGVSVVKPQWKAAVNFKWIRDNKDAVANNIRIRNSNANLELVLELYERVSNIQKVGFSFSSLVYSLIEKVILFLLFFLNLYFYTISAPLSISLLVIVDNNG